MKKRKPLIVIAMMVLGVAAFFGCGTSADEAYETFSLAMDKMVGPGQWSAKGHEANLKGGALVVNGLAIKMPPPQADEAAPATATDEAAPATAAGTDMTIEVATVEIKDILAKKNLETIIAATNWRDQKEIKLAEGIILKGLSWKMPAGPQPFDMAIEEVTLDLASLAAAGPDAPEGKAGFLKAINLGSWSYKNLKLTSQDDSATLEALIGLVTAKTIAFDGEPFEGFESIDPSGMTKIMTGMSCKSAQVKDLSLKFKSLQENVSGSITIASLDKKDVKNMGKIGELILEKAKMEIISPESIPITIALEKMNFTDLDLSVYLNRMAPFIAMSATDPERAAQLLSEFYTIGDMFTTPISLGQFSINGFEIDMKDIITFKVAETKVAGPYKARTIAPSQKYSVSGLEIIVPEAPKAEDQAKKPEGEANQENDDAIAEMKANMAEVREFWRQIGVDTIKIDLEGEGAYNPETGVFSSRLNKMEIKDVMTLSGTTEFGGLSASRLETLNNTPLTMIYIALMAPDAVFGDLSFNDFSLKAIDHGFMEGFYKFSALKESKLNGSTVSPEEAKKETLTTVETTLSMMGEGVLKDPKALANTLTTFLTKPGSLELSIKPQPPLTFKSGMAMSDDQNKLFNSLNISITANDEKAKPLVFDIGGAGMPEEAMPEEEPTDENPEAN